MPYAPLVRNALRALVAQERDAAIDSIVANLHRLLADPHAVADVIYQLDDFTKGLWSFPALNSEGETIMYRVAFDLDELNHQLVLTDLLPITRDLVD